MPYLLQDPRGFILLSMIPNCLVSLKFCNVAAKAYFKLENKPFFF